MSTKVCSQRMHIEEMVPTVPTEISRWFRKDILYHLVSAYILRVSGQHSLAVVKTFEIWATYVVVLDRLNGVKTSKKPAFVPVPTTFTVNKNKSVFNLLC
jgi:hypothetical protein